MLDIVIVPQYVNFMSDTVNINNFVVSVCLC